MNKTVTMEHIAQAMNTVEKVHQIDFNDMHKFMTDNEPVVVEGFQQIVELDSIDQRYSILENIFASSPDFNDSMPYMLEVTALVS
ncbi:hypothetical protein L3Q72_17530 [Vibrio sp. JC009]|uniref:hypothetical protein n=1 Tax=Vibrio sp. JC009 TaxID=2912314 RepID=UPI0023B0037B|nr:hypothetical protein [Vibrio sp. JC009]WED24677.1 hypothetical protein L3Q72_17530 [Vibrio sp. JC009]